MQISELLTPERCLIADVKSKKKIFETAASLLAKGAPGVKPHDIFETLLQREHLGSTAVGRKIAIPHGRIKNLDYPIAAFMLLQEAVPFDSPDKQNVDIFFILVVPEKEVELHLHLLADLAALFSQPDRISAIYAATDSLSLYHALLDTTCQL